MTEQSSTTLATLRRQPTNRAVTATELRLDICEAEGRTFLEIARWERAGGVWRKTSHCNRLQPAELGIVIAALEQARDRLRGAEE